MTKPQLPLQPIHQRTLLIDFFLAMGAVNFVINAAITWLFLWNVTSVPLFGGLQSIALDVATTSFFMPFFISIIATPITRKRVRSGSLPPIPAGPEDLGLIGKLPARARVRGAVLGLLALCTIAPVTILIFYFRPVAAMTFWQMVLFKGLYCAVLAAAVGPIVGLWAMLGPRSAQPSPSEQ